MTELTFGKAVDLSVMKWELKSINPLGNIFEVFEAHSQLIELAFSCGLCEYYGINEILGRVTSLGNCPICPLHDYPVGIGKICSYEYYKYQYARSKSDRRWANYWATKLLNRLYEIQLCCKAQGIK